MDTVTAYIALGANLGKRALTLMRAVKMVDDVPGVEVRRISSLIETRPVGGPEDQRNYINGVVEIRTRLAPRDLLAALQDIETALGRDRAAEQRWGPRTCDLDILLVGETIMDTDDLTLPHPRMCERQFVLAPLAEIAPWAVHPVRGKTASDLLAETRDNEGTQR